MKKILIILLVLAAGLIAFFVFRNNSSEKNTLRSNEAEKKGEEMNNEQTANEVVILETDKGNIKIGLRPDAAPKTVANFIKLANDGFYNNLTFHRIIPGFVIQGGDPKGDGTGGPNYTIPAEILLKHTRGAVAAARQSDFVNPDRESSGSQFYIALKDLPDLDGLYTVFGYVTEGMDAVDAIAKVPTDSNDKPLEPVHIKRAYVESK